MRYVLASLVASFALSAAAQNIPQPPTHRRPLKLGERVYNIEKDSAQAKVVGIQGHGKYVLEFLSGEAAGLRGSGWDRSSLAVLNACAEDLCTGNEVINIEKDSARARIVAIAFDGTYVLNFLSGEAAGLTGAKWDRASLAVKQGCSGGFCVGQRAYNTDKDGAPLVEIAAVAKDGTLTLNFLSGEAAGLTGSKWAAKDLARMSGCSGRYCVGDRAINITRDSATVKIVGIESDGRMVLEFLSGDAAGLRGAHWSRSDLAFTGTR